MRLRYFFSQMSGKKGLGKGSIVIENQFKQFLDKTCLERNTYKEFIESSPNHTYESVQVYFTKFNTKLDILYMIESMEAVLPDNDFTTNLLSLEFLAQKVIENEEKFDLFEMIRINEFFTKNLFYEQKLLDLLEERILADKREIFRQKEKAIETINKIISIYIVTKNVRPEMLFELANGVGLMYRENIINDRKLSQAVKGFLKTGDCFKLSGIVQNKIELKKKSFKEIIQIAEIAIPLKLLDKPKMLDFEDHLLKYLRLFLNENYSYDVLLKDSFESDLKVESNDILRLFMAFSDTGFFSPKLRDKLLIYVEKNIEGFDDNSFIKVLTAFSKGKYNFNNYKDLYEKLEYEAYRRLESMKKGNVIKSFYCFLKYGKLSVKLLKDYTTVLSSLEMKNIPIAQINSLLGSILDCESYLLPVEVIEEEKWKDHVKTIRANLEVLYQNIIAERVVPYLMDFKKHKFNLFLTIRTIELIFEVNDIFLLRIENQYLDYVHEILIHYNKDYFEHYSEKIKLLPNPAPVQGIENHKEFISVEHTKYLSPNDIVRIIYKYIQADQGLSQMPLIVDFLAKNFTLISKEHFVKMVHIFVRYEKVDLMNEILESFQRLHEYGDLRYFFSPKDYVSLVYNFFIFNSQLNGDYEELLQNLPYITLPQTETTEFDKKQLKKEIQTFLNLDFKEIVDYFFGLDLNQFSPLSIEQLKCILLHLVKLSDMVS